MSDIEVLMDQEFRPDQAIKTELANLIGQHNREDVPALQDYLEYSISKCNKLYVDRDQHGAVQAFLFAAWEGQLTGTNVDSVYVGLSSVKPDLKGRGVIQQLYEKCLKDVTEWERMKSTRLLLWATTFNRRTYRNARMLFPELEPDEEGNYSPGGFEIAKAIRHHYCARSESASPNPFVLKGVAKGVGSRHVNFSLFRKLGVNPTEGDRLLFILRRP